MITKLKDMIKTAMVEKSKLGANAKGSKEEWKYQTLKNILEKAQKEAKELKSAEVADSMLVNAARKEIKQQEDLLQYCKDRPEKQEEAKYCISVAEQLLPKQATQAEVEAFLSEHSSEITNIGAGMKILKEHFKDTLNSKEASAIVKKFIESNKA